eukprot:1328525-Pyramimonas_sp.AAC.1
MQGASDRTMRPAAAQGALAEQCTCTDRPSLPAPQPTGRWGLDPLFWVHARLLAYDFLRLSPNQEFPGANYRVVGQLFVQKC